MPELESSEVFAGVAGETRLLEDDLTAEDAGEAAS